MNTQTAKILTGLAALIAAGVTAQAQYIWITLNDPVAGTGTNGPDTLTDNFSGTNIVGGYGFWYDGGVIHGFVASGTNWTTLNDPLAGSGPNQGTYATGMSGTNTVGWFIDSNGVAHGFHYNGSTWITLNDPQVSGVGLSGDTYAQGIDGTNISGFCVTASGVNHGLLYNVVANTWTSLDDPLAGSQGTIAERIEGTNIVGGYYDGAGNEHGFLYNVIRRTWTTLNAPLAGHGSGQGTLAFNLSGTNIVGTYWDSSGEGHGFFYNGSTWTTLDAPLGVSTSALGIQGANVVGIYWDGANIIHGFLATPTPQLTLTLSSNALRVSWPYWNSRFTGWALQQSADLTTTNWTASGANVSNDGTNNVITIPSPTGNLFFRLQRQ